MADSTLNQIVSTDTITDDDLLLCYRQAINATRSISAQNFNKVNADRFAALELLIPSDTSESNQLVNKSEVLQKLQFMVNATNVRHIIFPSGYTGAVVVRLYMCNATNTADVRILGYNQLNNNYKGVYTQTGVGLFVNIATNYQIDICNTSSTSVDVIAEIYASQTASVDAGASGSFSYWGANFVNSDCSLKQNKTLDTPLTIGDVSQTTVEGALSALSIGFAKTQTHLYGRSVTPPTGNAFLVFFKTFEFGVEYTLCAVVNRAASSSTGIIVSATPIACGSYTDSIIIDSEDLTKLTISSASDIKYPNLASWVFISLGNLLVV